MNHTSLEVQTRPARIGDQGTLIGWESLGSMANLLIQISETEVVVQIGDWRLIRDIAEALLGEEVVVVEAEGSSYGCHCIRPLSADW